MNAMYSPPPVTVMAGAYLRMMSDGSGRDPGVIELNVWNTDYRAIVAARLPHHEHARGWRQGAELLHHADIRAEFAEQVFTTAGSA